MRTCTINGCEKPSRGLGFCSMHYTRLRTHGDPLYEKIKKLCTINGCNKKQFSSGYCVKHYTRLRRHGDPLYLAKEMHGMTDSKEYKSWACMKNRCYNVDYHGYYRYGARGITVCDRWLHSFSNFLEDMGEKPFPEAQLDRKENDKGYYKSNCRWVTPLVNVRNSTIAKLNIEEVRRIRKLHNDGVINNTRLAIMFNVTNSTIGHILSNKTWVE